MVTELYTLKWLILYFVHFYINKSIFVKTKSIFVKKKKNDVCTEICTELFTEALFIAAKRWKQPKYPSAEEWVNKMWSIHTMKYYSASKRKEILTLATTCMNIEDIEH